MDKLTAQLEAFPGSSVGFDCGGEFGTAVFDRRCRWCARFIETPRQITMRANRECDPVEFETRGVCSKCGPVELVFEGFL